MLPMLPTHQTAAVWQADCAAGVLQVGAAVQLLLQTRRGKVFKATYVAEQHLLAGWWGGAGSCVGRLAVAAANWLRHVV